MVAELPAAFDERFPAGARGRIRPLETRRRILEVAREQLARISYSEFSITGLARELGISKVAIYNQFLDKKAIYRESRRELIVSLTMDYCEEIPASMEPSDALTFFSLKLIELHSDPRMDELIGSVFRDRVTQPWLPQTFDQMIRNPILLALEGYLLKQSRTDRGSIKDPIRIANFLWAITSDLSMRMRQSKAIVPPNAINAEVGTFVKAFCALISPPDLSLPESKKPQPFPANAD